MFTEESVSANQKLCPKCRVITSFAEDMPKHWYGYCRGCDKLWLITGSLKNSPQEAVRVITVQITLPSGLVLNRLQQNQLQAMFEKFKHSLRSRKILGNFHLSVSPNLAPRSSEVPGGWGS